MECIGFVIRRVASCVGCVVASMTVSFVAPIFLILADFDFSYLMVELERTCW